MNKETPESNNEKITTQKLANADVYPKDAELPEGMVKCSYPFCDRVYREDESAPICYKCK